MSTRHLLAGISFLCISSFSAYAAETVSSSPISSEEFKAMLKQTLEENPEIVMDAIQNAKKRQQEDSNKLAKMGIEKNRDALFKDATLPSAGASIKNADVTIVEFFDYHCGYCKHMVPPLQQLLENDKKVRVVFMDFPILSQDSATAAQAAIAVNRIDPKKYFDFHAATMKHNGKFDDAAITKLAESVGINPSKLKKEMEKKEVNDTLQKIRGLGEAIGVHGTPALIVGDKFTPGAVSYEELKRLIAEARKPKS